MNVLCILNSPQWRNSFFFFWYWWQTQLQQLPINFRLSECDHRHCSPLLSLDSKKGTLSYQLGWTLPLSGKIRRLAALTNSKRKILTSLCISVPALTFLFCSLFKRRQRRQSHCLFLSSVCSFQEGGQWLWWGKKKTSFFSLRACDITGPVSISTMH